MSTIPVSSIVDVTISVSPTYPSRTGFGTLLCVTKETGVLDLANRIASYSTITGVGEDWDTDTEVYKVATAYFGQSPKPTSFMVGIRFEDDQVATLSSGSIDESILTTFQAITDGSLNISIDGSSQDITALDFSAVTGMTGIASVIQTGLQAMATGGFTDATCTYASNTFTIISGTSGETSLISYLTESATGTDISDYLEMQQGEATKSNGISGETISQSLTALNEVNAGFYGFAFTKEVREDVVINSESAVEAASVWAEARTKVYFTATNDELSYSSSSTTDIAYVLGQNSLSRTLIIYSSYPKQYPEVSIAGRAFSVAFTSGNPSITLKFKLLPGITVEDLSYNQKTVLDSKNCNSLVSVGGNTMLAEGVVCGGRFFDEIHGLDWLQDTIQTNVFSALYTNNKIPYTDPGIQILAQAVRSALAEGVTCGLLAAGEDSNGTYLSEGYVVTTTSVDDVSDSDKEARTYTGLSFTALGAGAIHSVTVSGVFER